MNNHLFRLVLWLPAAIFANDHLFTFGSISGRSMQPTINPDSNKLHNDLVLINKYKASFQRYRRGDVVILRSKDDPDHWSVKRIIGMDGDVVTTRPPGPIRAVTIPAGHCWVEGDERYHSVDSNAYGPLPQGLLLGTVAFTIYPRIRIVRSFMPDPSRVKIKDNSS